jgi:hypothetical protein
VDNAHRGQRVDLVVASLQRAPQWTTLPGTDDMIWCPPLNLTCLGPIEVMTWYIVTCENRYRKGFGFHLGLLECSLGGQQGHHLRNLILLKLPYGEEAKLVIRKTTWRKWYG